MQDPAHQPNHAKIRTVGGCKGQGARVSVAGFRKLQVARFPHGDCPKLLSIRGPIFGFLLYFGAL